jgi:hypothetical protein
MLVGSLLARPFAGRHNIGHGVGGEVRIMRTTAAVTSKLKIEPPVALETGYFATSAYTYHVAVSVHHRAARGLYVVSNITLRGAKRCCGLRVLGRNC